MATIEGIYLALFGRPADPGGLSYFNGITNSGRDLSKIGGLTGTAEYLTRFSDMTSTQIVTSIYKMMFNREPDQGGLKFFVGEFDAGRLTIENIAINILDGAQGSDKTIVENKLTASSRFTRSLDLVEEQALYAGTKAAEAGRQYLGGITAEASTIPDQAKTDAAIKALPPPAAGPFTVQQVIDGMAAGKAYILHDRVQNLAANPEITSKADGYSVANAEGGVGALTVAQAKILMAAKNYSSFDFSLADSPSNITAAMSQAVMREADTVAVIGSEQNDTMNFSGATRGLIINGAGGGDMLIGGKFNDNLRGDAGANNYVSGGGRDTITITPDNVPDTIWLNKSALGGDLNANTTVLYVDGFSAYDKFGISNADVFTDTGPTFDPSDYHKAPWTNPTFATYTGLHGSQAFDQSGAGSKIDSHNIAVFSLPNLNATGDLGSSLDGTQLFRGLSVVGSTRTDLDIAKNWTGYVAAYQNGKGYIYWAADQNGDGKLIASEFHLKVVVTGVAQDGFTADNFTLVS